MNKNKVFKLGLSPLILPIILIPSTISCSNGNSSNQNIDKPNEIFKATDLEKELSKNIEIIVDVEKLDSKIIAAEISKIENEIKTTAKKLGYSISGPIQKTIINKGETLSEINFEIDLTKESKKFQAKIQKRIKAQKNTSQPGYEILINNWQNHSEDKYDRDALIGVPLTRTIYFTKENEDIDGYFVFYLNEKQVQEGTDKFLKNNVWIDELGEFRMKVIAYSDKSKTQKLAEKTIVDMISENDLSDRYKNSLSDTAAGLTYNFERDLEKNPLYFENENVTKEELKEVIITKFNKGYNEKKEYELIITEEPVIEQNKRPGDIPNEFLKSVDLKIKIKLIKYPKITTIFSKQASFKFDIRIKEKQIVENIIINEVQNTLNSYLNTALDEYIQKNPTFNPEDFIQYTSNDQTAEKSWKSIVKWNEAVAQISIDFPEEKDAISVSNEKMIPTIEDAKDENGSATKDKIVKITCDVNFSGSTDFPTPEQGTIEIKLLFIK